MSGICGVVNFDGAPVGPETLQKMAQAAACRGPDGIRYWRNGSAGLVNLALNITPESFREQQPLVSHRGELVLTADARVDNRDELIRTLTTKGHLRDTSPTDADVILAAYECWGDACPAHIIGDFAFVIWDAGRRRLFAAREPMGTRALYYRVEPHRVLFATEVKQILAAPGVPARIFEPAVGSFLAGEVGLLPDWTYYQGIAQLPPARALAIEAGSCRVWRYWDIDPDSRIEYRNEHQYAEHFAEILKEAVRCRLRSARPVGIFLSGGVDSGSVASTAGWLLRQNGATGHSDFRAYCWAFDEFTRCDERSISDGIVRHYDLPVTYVPADTEWPLKDYPAHGPDRDEPYLSFYRALADRTLATARDEGTGLMLTGGLGDMMVGTENFDYLDQLREGRYARLWEELRIHGRSWNVARRKLVKSYMWDPFVAHLWPPDEAPRLRRALHLTRAYPEWVRPEFARRVGMDEILHLGIPRTTLDGFARRKRYQTIFWSVNGQDAVSWERYNARFGMGDADPFSDRRVVEFVMAVPQRELNRAGEFKLLARRAMRGVMPEEVRRAAGKGSMSPLLDAAIKQHAHETVLELIREPRAEALGFIDGRALAEDVAAYRRGEHGRVHFWFALALEMWLRDYWS